MMVDTDKQVVRSQQFPFIPLERCVARAREFEAAYGQNPGRPVNVVKTWGYTEKGSGGIQTIAALVSFGLLTDEGSGDTRRLRLSPLAVTIIKDKRAGAAESALKQAAVKPKVLAELWAEWGINRPPDEECLSILHIDKKFREDAAGRLLKIYDATVAYAKLANSDQSPDNGGVGDEAKHEVLEPAAIAPPLAANVSPPPALAQSGKVRLMPDERILFSYEQSPAQSIRILVTGQVDATIAEVLKKFAEFQASIAPTKAAEPLGKAPSEEPTT